MYGETLDAIVDVSSENSINSERYKEQIIVDFEQELQRAATSFNSQVTNNIMIHLYLMMIVIFTPLKAL